MGTTPNRLIPYAEPSDPVATDPATDKAASEILDGLLFDTGWVPMTVKAGFAPQSGWTPEVRRIGNVVYARGGLMNTGMATSQAYSGVLTVPAGYRPIGVTWAGAAGTSTGSLIGNWIVNGAGGVDLRTGPTLSAYYLLPGPVWFLN
jgi:hypothetical protein